MERADVTIVLITERILDQLEATLERFSDRKYPIVIPIPDIKGGITLKSDPIVELIRRKTGIEVKLG
jgi:vacuolar-type H+-ATPase subunit F/Vma7